MSEALTFKISSALKDILGRDLITDDFIAVFELVKNSYDAYSTRVDITFEKTRKGKKRIVIKDNGKGMSYKDLIKKWLFVAYSAKKEGTEDEDFDYRDNIYINRPFAGAKGIGRFSCDRLGRRLILETTKKKKNSKTEVLTTDWEQFEADAESEFVDISVSHDTIEESTHDLKHGTVLIIDDLRGEWDRPKYLKLKDSLAKLINPNRGKGEANFKIFIHVEDEKKSDSYETEEHNIVNGEIQNFIFETLGLKTTKIQSSISKSGKYIKTQLYDGGTLIYKIKELNTFSELADISYTIYYLNRSAKVTFTKKMGVQSIRYGHIFLYKSGFRVYPYGEPGEDTLKIDVRKTQGYNRYLGTRDIIGQIEIFSQSDKLKETTSRGDGLIKTQAYFELEEQFWNVLRRLEKYVVDVQRWGISIEDNEEDLNIESRITDLIATLTGSSDLIEFEYSDDFLSILEKSQSTSAEAIVRNLNSIAAKSNDSEIIKQAENITSVLKEIQEARKEAELEAEKQRIVANLAKQDLEKRESENLFLKSIKSHDFDEVVSFLHHIGLGAKNIDNDLKLFIKKLKKGKNIPQNELIHSLESILFENRKILTISRFASKANFKLFTASIQIDVANYIFEYVNNILGFVSTQTPRVKVRLTESMVFVRDIKPIELNIIIDNLLSNARRAHAKDVLISFKLVNESLEISIKNDGKNINPSDAERIFELGYTTTSGSGIGLFHIKKILNDMGGEIFLNVDNKEYTEFIIIIN